MLVALSRRPRERVSRGALVTSQMYLQYSAVVILSHPRETPPPRQRTVHAFGVLPVITPRGDVKCIARLDPLTR